MVDHPITTILAEIRAAQSEDARERLLSLRRRLQMTQAQFAEAIGMSLDAVKSCETGRTAADPARAAAAERLLFPR